MYSKNELRDMSHTELEKELGETRKTLFELKLAVRTGREKNTAKVKQLSKYIAQILTVRNSKKTEVEADIKKETKKANK